MIHFQSGFKSPWFLPEGHSQTVWPSFFRTIAVAWEPKEIEFATNDGDVLYADYYEHPNAKAIAVICHGLEGHSRRPYVLGMAKALLEGDFSVVAWNYRGCNGRMNKTPLFYHSGATYDLKSVLKQLPGNPTWPVFLIGFSLGGNLVLKFLGEEGEHAPDRVVGAAVVSVPLMLSDGADHLMKGISKLYTRNFLKSLKQKVADKSAIFPGYYRMQLLDSVKSLREFDEHFTAPIHGYLNADDYYAKASAGFVLEHITRPVLLLQAYNDPFLPASCFPEPKNDLISRYYTQNGGHVGFLQEGTERTFAEVQVLSFWEKLCITCSNPNTERR